MMEAEIQRIDNVIYGVKQDVPIDGRGIGRMIFEKMRENKNKVFQVNALTNEQQTYGLLNKKFIRTALEMRNRGIKSKDIVLTCSGNTMDTILPVYSALYLNAITVTLDPSISLRDSKYLLKTVAPKIIFVVEDAIDLIEKAIAEIENKPEIVVMGSHTKYATLSDFLKQQPNEDVFVPDNVEDVQSVSNIFFSSGTTGRPKAVLHSHTAMMKSCAIMSYYFPNLSTLLYYTSFYWISAFLITTLVMLAGGKRLYAGMFTPKMFLKHVENYKVTFSFLATSLSIQFSEEDTRNAKTDSLKDMIVGGSAFTEKQVLNLIKYFPHTQICLGYGQTEVGGVIALHKVSSHSNRSLNSCGFLAQNVVLKICDLETGRTLGPEEKGEIRVKAGTTFNGYLSSPDNVPEDPFDKDGFLKTGDIGYYDDENCLHFCDRIKEMFKYQSWHVVPASIETVIYEHPAVLETVVIGIPHEMDDHHPLALVTLKNGHCVDEGELLTFVNAKLSDREQLRAGLKIVKRLPRTATGKIARPQVRQLVFSGDLSQLQN